MFKFTQLVGSAFNYNKAKQHRSQAHWTAFSSLVLRMASPFAQTNQQKVCRCWRRSSCLAGSVNTPDTTVHLNSISYTLSMANLTLQKILQEYLPDIQKQCNFPLHQLKAIDKLSICRTAALGGHTQVCENGHVNGIWYNSCKHRSCPQCQGMASEQWLVDTKELLLDCPHHHIIFTLPSELNDLWRFNRKEMTNILFKATNETLKLFSQNPKYLGASPGILMALHTWGRNLVLHPHLHVVVSHGGISSSNEWVKPKKKHLFPAKPVMLVFKGKVLDFVKKGIIKNELEIPPSISEQGYLQRIALMRSKDWVVHFCDRYSHGRGVAKYLARYVKRSPFKNSQLRYVKGGRVSFVYQSHQSKKQEKVNLSVKDFLHRLLEHVPLARSRMVRYSGIYTYSLRAKVDVARQHLGQRVRELPSRLTWVDFMTGKESMPKCSYCGVRLFHGEEVFKLQS